MRYEKELGVARKTALKAGIVLKKYFKEEVPYKEGKDITDRVTAADKQSDRVIKAVIKKNFPDDEILSEESSLKSGEAFYRRWIIDPLDGTMNFTCGLPFCGVSIALEENGETVVGVIYFPLLNWTYTAVKGYGSFKNQKIIHIRESKSIKEAVIAEIFSDRETRGKEVKYPPGAAFRKFGSAVTSLMFLAEGKIDAAVLHCKIWDYAAAKLIIEEAGGKVTVRKKQNFDEVTASAPGIHEAMLNTDFYGPEEKKQKKPAGELITPFVFVGGAMRSRTTLLRLVLSAHPKVHITPETEFITKAVERFPIYRKLKSFELSKLTALIFNDRKLAGWPESTSRFFKKIREYDQVSLKQVIFDLLAETKKELADGTEIIGNKKPAIVDVGFYVKKMFPQARFIIITRDPRAVVASMIEKKVSSIPDVTTGALEWLRAEKLKNKLKRKYPADVLNISYERLVQYPELECKNLCAFLGVPYNEKMLFFYKENQNYEQLADYAYLKHEDTNKSFQRKNIEKWKKILKPEEVAIIEKICRKKMKQIGYKPISRQNIAFLDKIKIWRKKTFIVMFWFKKRIKILLTR